MSQRIRLHLDLFNPNIFSFGSSQKTTLKVRYGNALFFTWRMPATRSSTRSSVSTVNAASGVLSTKSDQLERNAERPGAPPRKRKTMAGSAVNDTVKNLEPNTPQTQISALALSAIPSDQDASEPEELVPAMLSFDFEEAKRHLIEVDHRFEDLFSKMQCKPFQHLEQVHPFRYELFFKVCACCSQRQRRALTTSIL